MAIATYLADKSAIARLRHPPVGDRLGRLMERGLVATCAVIDLEVLFSTISADQYEEVLTERRGFERLSMGEDTWDRALEVQRALAVKSMTRAVGIADLLVAATAERHRVTLLHYDADFDHIAAITSQPMEWIVPRGSVP